MPAKQERHFVVLLRKVFHGLPGYAVVGSQFAGGVIMAHLINHQALGGEPETCIHTGESAVQSFTSVQYTTVQEIGCDCQM
jgi:hypothetical protein